MFSDIYEIRDIGTKTRFFFIGDNADFKPDKSLPSFTTKIIPHYHRNRYNFSYKKENYGLCEKDITHHQMSLWADFHPESVPDLTVTRIIAECR